MTDLQDRIALEVLRKFEDLPLKSKPGTSQDGQKLWVPLSGIVIQNENTSELHCVALATGMKCLPISKASSARGLILHDWHAEVLAIRLFNDFLLQEINGLAETGLAGSKYLRRRDASEKSTVQGTQMFAIKDDIKIHMYCSEAPCGDASMELTISAQEDQTPWAVPDSRPGDSDDNCSSGLKGRGYFSELGIVRRKPARGDSPSTLSKSCTDKIALKQCTSLLSSPVSLLISPANAYISNLVIPHSQCIPSAYERAFSGEGRMKPLAGRAWDGGYAFRPFRVLSTSCEFSYSRRMASSKSSNVSAAWNHYRHETLINGVLQGRKQSDPRGASMTSRYRLLQTTARLASVLSMPTLSEALSSRSYMDIKRSEILGGRELVKDEAKRAGLQGWVPNVEDDFKLVSEINPEQPSLGK